MSLPVVCIWIGRAPMLEQQKREYMHQYRLEHPGLMLNYARRSGANKRARQYGAPGELTLAEVETIMAAGCCFYCGSSKKLGLDHVIPLHAGGPNRPENIVCACHSCNQSKGRADRPGRWSQLYEACQGCGTTATSHAGRGLCRRCQRAAQRQPRKRRSDVAPPNRTCERCGIAFHKKPRDIQLGRGRFCSLACRWPTPSRLHTEVRR
jgi:hypothetical protein